MQPHVHRYLKNVLFRHRPNDPEPVDPLRAATIAACLARSARALAGLLPPATEAPPLAVPSDPTDPPESEPPILLLPSPPRWFSSAEPVAKVLAMEPGPWPWISSNFSRAASMSSMVARQSRPISLVEAPRFLREKLTFKRSSNANPTSWSNLENVCLRWLVEVHLIRQDGRGDFRREK